jgi:SAM-dependent methyltransferase
MTEPNLRLRQIDAVCSAVVPRLKAADDFKSLRVTAPAEDGEGLRRLALTRGPGGSYTLDSDGEQKRIESDALEEEIRGLVGLGYSDFRIESFSGLVEVSLTDSGVKVGYEGLPKGPGADDVSNIDKSYLIKAGEADDLLRAIGIMTADGEIRAEMRSKFRQINHMIELIRPQLESAGKQPKVVVLDAGCGKSYLSFVINFFLRSLLKANCRVIGIDSNPEVIAKSEAIRNELGYSNMAFETATIDEYTPDVPIDFLLSLHACDTATDEAIAKGVELAKQISCPPLAPVTKHSMFRMHLADLATDALRALALEAMGYRVDVLEFVSPDVTPKNIMLRAEKVWEGSEKALREFRAVRDFLGVDPRIQHLIPRLAG